MDPESAKDTQRIGAVAVPERERTDRFPWAALTHAAHQRPAGPVRDGDLAVYYQFAAYQAWVEGRQEDALAACRRAFDMAVSGGFESTAVSCGLGLAVLYAESGRNDLALRLLSQSRQRAARMRSTCMQFVATMIGAHIAHARGKAWFCLAYLRHALTTGATYRFYSLPWLTPQSLCELLNIARAHGIERGYVEKLASEVGIVLNAGTPTAQVEPRSCVVQTLGGLQVRFADVSTLPNRKTPKKPLTLLLHLVASGRAGVSVEQSIETLWPETEHEVGYTRLKTTVGRLRALLGNEQAVAVKRNHIYLEHEHCDVDAWQIEAVAHNFYAYGESDWDAALRRYRGPFFAGFFDDRELQLYQVHVHNQFLRLVAQMGQHYRQRGEEDGALAVFSEALRLDPLNERLCEEVLVSLAASGRHHEIQILFNDFTRRCEQTLDGAVSARLQARYLTLREP